MVSTFPLLRGGGGGWGGARNRSGTLTRTMIATGETCRTFLRMDHHMFFKVTEPLGVESAASTKGRTAAGAHKVMSIDEP